MSATGPAGTGPAGTGAPGAGGAGTGPAGTGPAGTGAPGAGGAGTPVGGQPAGEGRLTHIDERGHARMVDVTAKLVTQRRAEARCTVRAAPDAVKALSADLDVAWGDARRAGIHAAKLTSQLIPLCHPLPLDDVEVRLSQGPDRVEITAVTSVENRTGVEMEALSACAFAGLSLLATLLAHDPTAQMDDLTLWHKSGGRSGVWQRDRGTGDLSQEGGAGS